MLLSDRDIRAAITRGEMIIDPHEPTLVQPSSVDVRLGHRFLLMRPTTAGIIDPRQPQPELFAPVEVPEGQPFRLNPGEFALAATYEEVTLGAGLAARVEGKSSLGRLGYQIHSTAGFIDPGFSGHVTLEITNNATLPQLWWPGMKVGQLSVYRLSSLAEHPYGSGAHGSRYQGQAAPQASLAWLHWKDWSEDLYRVG